jgi:hypothetical protein
MMNERFAILFPLGLGGDPPCPPRPRHAGGYWLDSLIGLLCSHCQRPR